MMIKLVNPDCDAATTCRIYELQSGEIILYIEYETIDSISFVGLSEPMSVEAAITAIKNNALAEIKTSGEETNELLEDVGSNTLLKIALDRLVDRGTIMSYNLRNGDATIICDL